jgi:hypothetical protein
MLRLRFSLVLAASLFILLPTGCQKDGPNRIDGVENTTSPVQLSEWMQQLGSVIRATNTSGEEASRILAYASVAYYEGYALSSESMRSLAGQLEGLEALPQPDSAISYNFGIVAEAAMYKVLDHMYSNAPNNIQIVLSSTYVDHERDYLQIGVSEAMVNRSRNFGTSIGQAIVDWSSQDGFSNLGNCSTSVPNGPNDWQPTPPSFSSAQYVCWGDLRAFTFSSSELITLCHPGIPVEFATPAYSAAVNEVYEIGNNLNPAQKEIARFWQDGSGTFTVPGHYISILGNLIDQNVLNGEETVTAFAHLCIAMADTYISTYRLKYTYFRPRPTSTIQQSIDSNWESEINNPATPEFPSMRATMAYAAAQVFNNRYGALEFRDDTYTSILGIDERIYSSFDEMADQAALSRIYAGTNLRITTDKSEYHGRCIAQRANELFFIQ